MLKANIKPDFSNDLQIDEDLTARINMADAKFSFQEKGRIYSPAWMSPEGKFDLELPPKAISLVIFQLPFIFSFTKETQ